MLKIKNATVLPRRYYGLHMVEGLAEYKDIQHDGNEPFRIYLSENVIKQMDATFTGRPVFANHVPGVDLANLEHEADGWVVKSFFNRADGKHWVEFMVVTDTGHEAISKGWKLSNAYIPKRFGNSGVWHAMPYAKEVLEAEYEHLAIVSNPRYQESVILTPEEFKNYNDTKEAELISLQNSITASTVVETKEIPKGVKKVNFNFWNKEQVKNADEVAQMCITLPRSGREVTISQLVNEMDKAELDKKENSDDEKKEDPKANKKNAAEPEKKENDDDSEDAMENEVDVGDGKKVKMNALVKKWNESQAAEKKQNSDKLEAAPALATPGTTAETSTQNAMDAIRNAADKFENEGPVQVVPFDSLATGYSRYGSK